MSAKREPRLRLYDMLEAIDKVQERTVAGYEAFMHDEMLQVWIFYNLEVIGEASVHVPDAIKRTSPEVAWSTVAATRNRLVHGYFDVDLDAIWETATRDLPVLRAQVVRILDALE